MYIYTCICVHIYMCIYMCFLAQYINFGIPANVATFRFKEGPKN